MLLSRDTLPDTISDTAALDELLCRPSQALIDDLADVDGDIMILGVAGKMGPTLAGLAKAALPHRRIIGVARFSDTSVKAWLESRGIERGLHLDHEVTEPRSDAMNSPTMAPATARMAPTFMPENT